MLTERIVKELKWEREAQGLTQQDVAKRMGKHVSAVQDIEYHTREPRLSTIERYAAALDVTVEVKVRTRTPS